MTHAAAFPPLNAPSRELLARLTAIVGDAHALVEAARQAPFLIEWRDKYIGRTPVVLRPGSTAEVARILAVANEARVAIVPQGGNTGLVGGQIPRESGTEIVLSLGRLDRSRGVDAAATSMIVEAGMTLAAAQEMAAGAGRLLALSLASEGSCQIGGNLATNAGGVAVLAYGNARAQCLGIEAVLADGSVWNGLGALKKDNTGYDLKDLLIGSEGTLGVITAATLKLWPRPAERATAFVPVADMASLLDLFRLAERRCGGMLTAFEFMSARTLAFVTAHIADTHAPFADTTPWSALIETSGLAADGQALAMLEAVLAQALEAGLIGDAVVAASGAQAAALWKLRESASEAQKPEGGSIKHDVSVPVDLMPRFLADADAVVERICPGARPVPFGHFGDGNVHYNVSQPRDMDKARLALWEEMSEAVHTVVVRHGGSISAEHGIGRMKRDELARRKHPVALDMMRRIKAALDPNGILNPGRVI